jgi:predicted amidophosphoribosyltransferase
MNNDNAATVHAQAVEPEAGSASLRYSVTRPRRCRQCGTDVSRSIKRCPNCGQPLSAHPRTG